MIKNISYYFRWPFAVTAFLSCFMLLGCSATHSTPRVKFRSLQNGHAYMQRFSQAAFSRSDSGQVQVVLIDQAIDAPRPAPAHPIPPSDSPPLKQIITIRVLWRPARAIKPDDFTSTNAAIDWYVVGQNSTGMDDRLHYQGSGFVRVVPRGDFATVEMSNAKLELVDRAGNLQDPLGGAEVSASILVRRNEPLAAATLADLRARFSHEPTPASALQGPPPRSPGGP